MWKSFSFACLFAVLKLTAQSYSGQLFLRENSSALYINRAFVTNLNTQVTILSGSAGQFTIAAKPGDIIRFTSAVAERKDITLTAAQLGNPHNYIELQPAFHDIAEIVLKFKPSKDLRKDVLTLKDPKKSIQVASIIGLPEPKGDGYSPTSPVAAFKDGGMSFSIQTIYDLLSGDANRYQRLKNYEIMNSDIAAIRQFFGDDYFRKMKIPVNLTDDFLAFVYKSDDLHLLVAAKNFEATKPFIEKYLPVYLQRVEHSHLNIVKG